MDLNLLLLRQEYHRHLNRVVGNPVYRCHRYRAAATVMIVAHRQGRRHRCQ